MMHYPIMLAVELNDDCPLALAWTLADGQYKAVYVQPDDQAEHWDASFGFAHGLSQADLQHQGESIIDIVRELLHDIDCDEIYCEHPQQLTPILEQLFEQAGHSLPFTLQPIHPLLGLPSLDALDEQRHSLCMAEGLNPGIAEDCLRCFQQLYARGLYR